ncbi:probable ATP-dependent RNA helicase DDX20 [Teleopsis dalmanni]|uniref:probable ATP-dependent RNA helicase DDX20 n=1 Tax=Teleopsis dalmanni TaxID=139649 RepID=UPI0018CD340C|nr:probable ATP-dependent RNA helicase DDX20 [Teleopsis dalmanni]
MEGPSDLAHKLSEERTSDVCLMDVPFHKMSIGFATKQGLCQAGFEYPTLIQASAIPVGCSGFDLLVQSKSGTGKTIIFTTIILESYDYNLKQIQSIVITPTREIATQITDVLNKVGKCFRGFNATTVIGGTNIQEDRKRIQLAKSIVVTPGKFLHLLRSKMVNTSKIKLLVIDEADQMYDEGFRKDVDIILKQLPIRQIVVCSATFPNDLYIKLSKLMHNPYYVSTQEKSCVLIGIKQYAYTIPEQKVSLKEMNEKLKAINYIFAVIPFKQCLLFAGTQLRASSYCGYLQRDGWGCEIISGAQSQIERAETFKKFREEKIRILVTTDLMARGIDALNVNLVINVDQPKDAVTYLHRIGRAGRFGSHGISITLIATEKEEIHYKKIIDEIGAGILNVNVLNFPNTLKESDLYDFWNFSNLSEEISRLGLYNKKILAPLASEDRSITSSIQSLDQIKQTKDCDQLVHYRSENTEVDEIIKNTDSTNCSINTKTFLVNTQDSACNVMEKLVGEQKGNPTEESYLSSSTRFLSSNTIDDASSIAPDSSIRSLETDLLGDDIYIKESSKAILLDLLVSKSDNINNFINSRPKSFNIFDDYAQFILNHKENKNENEKLQDESTSNKLKKNVEDKIYKHIHEKNISAAKSSEKRNNKSILNISDVHIEKSDDSSKNMNGCKKDNAIIEDHIKSKQNTLDLQKNYSDCFATLLEDGSLMQKLNLNQENIIKTLLHEKNNNAPLVNICDLYEENLNRNTAAVKVYDKEDEERMFNNKLEKMLPNMTDKNDVTIDPVTPAIFRNDFFTDFCNLRSEDIHATNMDNNSNSQSNSDTAQNILDNIPISEPIVDKKPLTKHFPSPVNIEPILSRWQTQPPLFNPSSSQFVYAPNPTESTIPSTSSCFPESVFETSASSGSRATSLTSSSDLSSSKESIYNSDTSRTLATESDEKDGTMDLSEEEETVADSEESDFLEGQHSQNETAEGMWLRIYKQQVKQITDYVELCNRSGNAQK